MTRAEEDYGIVIAKDVMVAMRDGVRLATDVYRPARDGEPVPGKLPAILGRTSYDKNSPQIWVEPVGEFFCRYGYVVVIQDLRGRQHFARAVLESSAAVSTKSGSRPLEFGFDFRWSERLEVAHRLAGGRINGCDSDA